MLISSNFVTKIMEKRALRLGRTVRDLNGVICGDLGGAPHRKITPFCIRSSA